MSNIYHAEPVTSGKVVIHTTFGDIDVELWSKEAPLACRNFIQLALEGYYDNTIVHRIIKNFMVQMGDPTGTGTGGESIWGRPFKDEVHGRIKFNHRGQVAMANSNKPNSNQSQFFITLDSCDWLHGKHTIFGKVTGSTFYNVMRIGEVDTGDSDRPSNEIRITSVEVLLNPFDDIVPRIIAKPEKESESTAQKSSKDAVRTTAVKNNKLLSFGDDEEEEDTRQIFKMRSLQESKKRKRDETTNVSGVGNSSKQKSTSELERTLSDNNDSDKFIGAKSTTVKKTEADDDILDEAAMALAIKKARKTESGKSTTSSEFTKLKEELLKSRRAANVLTGEEAAKVQKQTAFQEMLTPLEQRRQKYMNRKSQIGHREDETLSRLGEFKKSLQASKSGSSQSEEQPKSDSYRGQILQKDSDEEDDLNEWHSGKLKFKRHVDDSFRHGGDKFRIEEYEVIDPKLQRLKTHQ